ncbi:hypothetical protein JTE90_004158 [Oedothorax gibbosus]|uniref:Uncharacterized protein n=1 Tax=Oedothorax gibbosus TaxID=931172 RepID=A0AAV6TV04_9ARAC|nr:hypothetical protein JTE90_004158 [Oedothorax gibbosus]
MQFLDLCEAEESISNLPSQPEPSSSSPTGVLDYSFQSSQLNDHLLDESAVDACPEPPTKKPQKSQTPVDELLAKAYEALQAVSSEKSDAETSFGQQNPQEIFEAYGVGTCGIISLDGGFMEESRGGGKRNTELNDASIYMICKDNLPHSMVDKEPTNGARFSNGQSDTVVSFVQSINGVVPLLPMVPVYFPTFPFPELPAPVASPTHIRLYILVPLPLILTSLLRHNLPFLQLQIRTNCLLVFQNLLCQSYLLPLIPTFLLMF